MRIASSIMARRTSGPILINPAGIRMEEETMKVRDDRTEEQKKTHRIIIGMTDSFMSGWGGAEGGVSYAGWACTDGDQYRVERWVRSRSDAKRVRILFDTWRPKGIGDCHIYVVEPGHAALA